MRKFLNAALKQSLSTYAPATGIGLFRSLYGIIVFQEIIFLLYFNALIFDPIPYLDVAFPLIPLYLCLWGCIALCLITGLFCQFASIANYCFWIIFVSFTPMRHEFDGGFDQFMTGVGLLLIFLPINRCFALDNLRFKLRFNRLTDISPTQNQVSILAYYIPIILCLAFLYIDSAIHKLFAEHWRNGLGAWLPSTSPYYISAIDMSWLLNNKLLQMTIGYGIYLFQFSFIFLIFKPFGRVTLLIIGALLHIGITLSLNIYPFGLSMLICYVLLVPFSWWRQLGKTLSCKTQSLTLFYDENSPAANHTAMTINHFDIFNTIKIKSRQRQNEFDNSPISITPFNTLDIRGQVDTGLKAWVKILIKMRYSALLGWILLIPSIFHWVDKKYQTMTAKKHKPGSFLITPENHPKHTITSNYYDRLFENYAKKHPKRFIHHLSKILILIFCLQLNSTLHYGLAYRLNHNQDITGLFKPLATASNSILVLTHTFLGITPHALYLHDHFEGYDQILAITYLDDTGQEKWLPFINQEGRLLAPNWGRVQSMWANVAVTPNIDNHRLSKFIMKITAFWGTKIGLDLNQTNFIIKRKDISTPTQWQFDLRNKNLQGQWQNIGTAHWQDFKFSLELSDKILQK